jgi:hypothetical protein
MANSINQKEKMMEYRIVTFVVPAGESLKEFDKWVGSNKWINNKIKLEEHLLKDENAWNQACAGIASVCYRFFTAGDRVKALSAEQGSSVAAKKKVGA